MPRLPARALFLLVPLLVLLLLLHPTTPPASAAPIIVTVSTVGSTTWTVPPGVTQATFDVYGAQGGRVPSTGSGSPGLGGHATVTLAVTPETVYQLVVGDRGKDASGTPFLGTGGAGGFNGGGSGSNGIVRPGSGGGGGASDVRSGACAITQSCGLGARLIVAGGGGGGGNHFSRTGGGGGGLVGGDGGTPHSNVDGAGGTQSGGGAGASDGGQAGTLGQGGNGVTGDGGSGTGGGGGGGGGYYGGGGGFGIGAGGGAGGGGSGFPATATFETGVRAGNGLITITFTPDTSAPVVSVSGTPTGTNGWFRTSPAVLSVSASDAATGNSPITALSCTAGTLGTVTPSLGSTSAVTAPLSVGTQGSTSLTCSATDGAGNQGSSPPFVVKLDSVPPTVALNAATNGCVTPGNAGWCRGTQTAGFSASDATSGVAQPSFTRSSSTNGAAVLIPSGQVCDLAGNCNPGISAGPFKLDSVVPGISVQSLTAGGQPYTPGQQAYYPVIVVFACSDAGSGPVSATVTRTVSTTGTNQTATGTCTDLAGNTASTSVSGITIPKLTPVAPTPTPSATPGPTPTAKPQPTVAPTATPTPLPTSTPKPPPGS